MAIAIVRYTLVSLMGVALAQAQDISFLDPQSNRACADAAEQLAVQLKQEGKPESEIQRAYQARMLACAGLKDPAFAAYAAAVNIDFARFARMFLHRKLTAAQYLHLVRDRKTKLKMARTDRAFLAAFANGDSDGDLIPDDRDKCPKSRDTIPTTRSGCPTTARPPRAPSDTFIERAKRGFGVMMSKECDSAPLPERPSPLHQGFLRPTGNVNDHFFGFTVTRVTNQPAGCIVFYEFTFRLTQGLSGSTRFFHMLFQDKESTDTGPKKDRRRVFKVKNSDSGQRRQLFLAYPGFGRVEWRVRAVNGSGMASGWSPLIEEPFNGVFRPD